MHCKIIPSVGLIFALYVLILAPVAGHADSPQPTPANLLAQTQITLNTEDRRAPSSVEQVIPIRPEWTKVLVRGNVRVPRTIKPDTGASQQAGACVHLAWRMKSTGRRVNAPMPHWLDPTYGWVEVNQLLDVPSGADRLIIAPEIEDASGAADFKDLSVVAWLTTFDDEFDGHAIDTGRWTVSDNDKLLYEPGEQYFAPDHVIVGSGIARFHADKTPHSANGPRIPLDGRFENMLYGDYRYQSGEICSTNKFQQLYGYWEFRLKIPLAVGTWPAAYLLGWDEGWPPEIDVEESSGNIIQTVIQTVVYADSYGRMKRSWANFPAAGLDRSDWHTYGIAWEPDSIAWYIDGTYKGSAKAPEATIPDVATYIRLNLAVGTFGGDPSVSSWPQDMDCDYVRVYQRSDLPLPLYAEPSVEITLPTNSVMLKAIGCNPMTGIAAKWALLEGPSEVTIQNPHALETKAIFSKPGMYRFKLSIAKGLSNASRNLLVYVNPGPTH